MDRPGRSSSKFVNGTAKNEGDLGRDGTKTEQNQDGDLDSQFEDGRFLTFWDKDRTSTDKNGRPSEPWARIPTVKLKIPDC